MLALAEPRRPTVAWETSERDEVLSQDPDPDRKVAQFIGKTYRLPEAAQVFAAGCSRAYMC
jgi:hypothetical protein